MACRSTSRPLACRRSSSARTSACARSGRSSSETHVREHPPADRVDSAARRLASSWDSRQDMSSDPGSDVWCRRPAPKTAPAATGRRTRRTGRRRRSSRPRRRSIARHDPNLQSGVMLPAPVGATCSDLWRRYVEHDRQLLDCPACDGFSSSPRRRVAPRALVGDRGAAPLGVRPRPPRRLALPPLLPATTARRFYARRGRDADRGRCPRGEASAARARAPSSSTSPRPGRSRTAA